MLSNQKIFVADRKAELAICQPMMGGGGVGEGEEEENKGRKWKSEKKRIKADGKAKASIW